MRNSWSPRALLVEKNLHVAFEISLVLKAAFALAEILASIFAYVVSKHFLVTLVDAVTRAELSEDPRDFIANHLLHSAQALSLSSQRFTAFYLLTHGAVKLWLIVGLWRKRPAYYPTAITVFGLFIVYQLYRFQFTHSPLLLLITIMDLVVIGLTWSEYRYLRRAQRGV